MFKKDRNILNEIVRDLTGERYILKIIVFGSRVRDDNRGDSDLDILVIVERKERKIKDKIREIFFEYELKYEISFGLIILSLEEWEINKKMGSSFVENVMKEGIIIYDSEQGRKKDPLKASF